MQPILPTPGSSGLSSASLRPRALAAPLQARPRQRFLVPLPASGPFPLLGCGSASCFLSLSPARLQIRKGRRSLISHSLHRAWHRIGAQRLFFIVLNKRNKPTRNFTVGHEWEQVLREGWWRGLWVTRPPSGWQGVCQASTGQVQTKGLGSQVSCSS